MGVSYTVLVLLDQQQQNIFDHISLFWSVGLQGHLAQESGDDHGWLIQTPVSTVQRGTLVRSDADTCTPERTLYIQFASERAANVVDLERHR